MLQNRPTAPIQGAQALATAMEAVPRIAPEIQRTPNLTSQKAMSWRVMLPVALGVLFLLERAGPTDYKPSTLIGGFTGHEEATRLRTQLASYQATEAAKNEEIGRMQKEVQDFREQTVRVTEAYKALYQRATNMAQVAAQTEQQFLMKRQEMVARTQEGNILVSQLADIFGAGALLMGNKDTAKSALQFGQAARESSVAAYDKAMRDGLSTSSGIFANWQTGLPDINAVNQMVQADRTTPLRTEPRAAPPLPPSPYQSPMQRATATPQAAPVQPAAASRPAQSAGATHTFQPASIKLAHVFVRSEPAVGDNKVCVLARGQLVAVIGDADGKPHRTTESGGKQITFVPVAFNREGHGFTKGWVGEKALENSSASMESARAAQPCLPPESAG